MEGLGANPDSAVTVVDISNTNLTDEGAKAVAEWLRGNVVVTTLWANTNSVTDAGVAALEEVLLCCNTKLSTLLVDENPASEDARERLKKLASVKRTGGAQKDEL